MAEEKGKSPGKSPEPAVKKPENKEKPAEVVKAEITRIDVTLVRIGQNRYQGLGPDGKQLLCGNCTRPVEASLHNVSIPDPKLGPCGMVKLYKI